MVKRTVDEYLRLPYTIEVFRDDDEENPGWVARVVEFPGCITQGDTFEELGEMIEDAMRGWISVALEDGQDIPEPRPEETFSGKFIVRVPKSLHRELVQEADREGVSLNMFVSTALGKSIGQVSTAVEKPPLHEEVDASSIIQWPKISEAAQKLLISQGYRKEVNEINEQLFASWIDNYLDNINAAIEAAELSVALQYIRTLQNGLSQVCENSPLIKTYCRVVSLLESQVSVRYRLYQGIVEQNLVKPKR